MFEKSDIAYGKDLLTGKDITDADDVWLSITPENLEAISWSSYSRTSFEDVDNFSITRESWDGFVNVTVKHDKTNLGTYSFPITKSLVTGDGRTGCPDPKYGYYEYSLSLDCMMVRADENNNNNHSSRYRISRLYGQALYNNNNQNQTPNNIYAVLLPESNWTYYTSTNTPSSLSGVTATYACRAINDPVYCTGTSGKADGIHYNYQVKEKAAKYDDRDSYLGDENKYKVTGKGVVNTHFGDANYSKDIGGTTFTKSNNVTSLDAVITSYRHLYNIRGIQNNTVATFRIVKDLDWYVHETVNVEGNIKE